VLWRRSVRAQLSRFHRIGEVLAGRSPTVETDPSYAQAAVALVCVPDPDAILLIRRSERPGDPWSGQMGLPGGRRGVSDPDLLSTAVRETAEEVGIQLSEADVAGALDDLTPRTVLLPRIVVRPYVFRLPRRTHVRHNPEVAAAAWVDLDRLLGPGIYGDWDVEAGGRRMRFPGYRLPEGIVWGMTERILTPFLQALTGSE
jgi:8-oxo-dGTP pyrophosphatase MutT (NUDIX family)